MSTNADQARKALTTSINYLFRNPILNEEDRLKIVDLLSELEKEISKIIISKSKKN